MITVEFDAAVGPRAFFDVNESVEQVLAALPAGWTVPAEDQERPAKAADGRYAVRLERQFAVTRLHALALTQSELEKFLGAAFAPFGTLGAPVDGGALAASIVSFTKAEEVADRARLAGEILANLWRTDEQDVCAVEFAGSLVRLRTPTSGTVIECSSRSVSVDFGERGSTARALTILRASEEAGIRFGERLGQYGLQAVSGGAGPLARRDVVALLLAAEARDDARTFVDEFRVALDPETTDWDADAYEQSPLAKEAEEELGVAAWPTYQRALIAETQRLAGSNP